MSGGGKTGGGGNAQGGGKSCHPYDQTTKCNL